ncbi:MAG TPA: membrane protein insertion efficiency factor YidD [Rhizomicrobium sp.]|jgi:putative membrane protein insertion efficiency factor|nr:membrane protein insertion efficiency factor YidD [Rhizomicrobium sp.]
MRKLIVALLSAPIRAYRTLISPLMPNSCRFTPSCSTYALEALHQHGPIKGLWLTAKRLSRCHPISWLGGSSGFDPVPLSKRQIQRSP